MTYYNYIYLDPRKPGCYCYEGLNFSLLYEPFYVGKGLKHRKFTHLCSCRLRTNTRKNNKIKKIITFGFDIRKFVLQINSKISEQQSLDIELDLITKIGMLDIKTGPLTNVIIGGIGSSGRPSKRKGKSNIDYYGIDKAREIQEKRSASVKANPQPPRKHTEEAKRKISLNQPDHHGINNCNSIWWKLISPEGEIFEFVGGIKSFLADKGIDYTSAKPYFNKGIIPKASNRPKRNKLTGWEIIQL